MTTDKQLAELAEVLGEHWDIEGMHAEGFECSCGYGLGDGTGDLDGRHRRHFAEMVAAEQQAGIAGLAGEGYLFRARIRDDDACLVYTHETCGETLMHTENVGIETLVRVARERVRSAARASGANDGE